MNVKVIADAESLKTELQNLIKTTKETYKQEDYTEASYKTLSEALTKAEGVISNAQATADNITEAINAINDAVKSLYRLLRDLKLSFNQQLMRLKL